MIFANVTYMFGSALSQACQVVVARLMGAREMGDTHRQVMSTLKGAVLVSGGLSVLLCLAARPVYSIFTKDPQILALAGTIMLIEIPLELGRAVNMVMCRALQACGDIRFPTVICVIDAWLVGVGGSFFLGIVLGWGLAGLWAAMAADECIRAVLFLIRWQSGVWQQKRLLDAAGGNA